MKHIHATNHIRGISGAILATVLTALLLTACSPAPVVSDDTANQETPSVGSG